MRRCASRHRGAAESAASARVRVGRAAEQVEAISDPDRRTGASLTAGDEGVDR